MLQTVIFISQYAMETHIKPNADTAVISITDDGDPDALIKPGFAAVLRLQFRDLYEEIMNETVGNIPDARQAQKPESKAGRVLWHGQVLPDTHHAQEILGFIQQQHNNPAIAHLVVHCHAGISRSAAIAAFVADQYGARLDMANPDTSGANRRVSRLLRKVLSGDQLYYGNYHPDVSVKEIAIHYAEDKPVGLF